MLINKTSLSQTVDSLNAAHFEGRALAAAERSEVAFRDLWDEPFVAAPTETGWWRDWWLAAGERDGHPVRIGAVTDSGQPDDWLTAIANGHGVALAPESAARSIPEYRLMTITERGHRG